MHPEPSDPKRKVTEKIKTLRRNSAEGRLPGVQPCRSPEPSYVIAARLAETGQSREFANRQLRCAMFNRAEQNHSALQERGQNGKARAFASLTISRMFDLRLHEQILNRGGSLFALFPSVSWPRRFFSS